MRGEGRGFFHLLFEGPPEARGSRRRLDRGPVPPVLVPAGPMWTNILQIYGTINNAHGACGLDVDGGWTPL